MAIIEAWDLEGYANGASIPGSLPSGQNNLFDGIQQKASGRVKATNSPSLSGQVSAEVTVLATDTDVSGSGNGQRTEFCCGLGMSHSQATGTSVSSSGEFWYAWSTYFRSSGYNPKTNSGWNIFQQIHNSASGQANHHFEINTAASPHLIRLRSHGGAQNANAASYTLLPSFNLNTRYDFVFGVKYSTSNTGWVEVWVNGTNVLPRVNRPTIYTNQGVYWKAGYYRGPVSSSHGSMVVVHDNWKVGTARTDVMAGGGGDPPPPPPPPPANPDSWFLNSSDVADMKSKYDATTEPVKTAGDSHISRANSEAESYSGNPPNPPSSWTSSNWNPDLYQPGLYDGKIAYSSAIAYILTNDITHANRARNIIHNWATTYFPPTFNTFHYVADSVGIAIKAAMAYELTRDSGAYSSSQHADIINWFSVFADNGRQKADLSRTNPWFSDQTIEGETWNAATHSNGARWQRCMAVCAAGVVGGTKLQEILDWNWSANPNGLDYSWDYMIDKLYIGTTGEAFDGRHRVSQGYGAWNWASWTIIAWVARNSGFHTDLYNYVSNSGKTLSDGAKYYGPIFTDEVSYPYAGSSDSFGSMNVAQIQQKYLGLAELDDHLVDNVLHSSNGSEIDGMLADTDVDRNTREDDHIFYKTGVFAFTLTDPPPDPDPVPDQNTHTGNWSAVISFNASEETPEPPPAPAPVTVAGAFTIENLVTDRTYDANSTTTAELADVLGTLLVDIDSGSDFLAWSVSNVTTDKTLTVSAGYSDTDEIADVIGTLITDYQNASGFPTLTNYTIVFSDEDRIYDADSTTIEEIAQVTATLINDLTGEAPSPVIPAHNGRWSDVISFDATTPSDPPDDPPPKNLQLSPRGFSQTIQLKVNDTDSPMTLTPQPPGGGI